MEEQREMAVEQGDELAFPAAELRETDISIMRLLESEGVTVAFQGLRRMMNVHQETL